MSPPQGIAADAFVHTGFDLAGQVPTITLDRPERRNALNWRAHAELESAFRPRTSTRSCAA
ncbi:MAG: hypothetical protein JNL87_01475 [Burkholderiaceae bacterium]|nr:hypothetical protein [Burkholderiaceae bacterium]